MNTSNQYDADVEFALKELEEAQDKLETVILEAIVYHARQNKIAKIVFSDDLTACFSDEETSMHRQPTPEAIVALESKYTICMGVNLVATWEEGVGWKC